MIRGENNYAAVTDVATTIPTEVAGATRATSAIALRVPTAEDGAALHRLVAQCPPLDPNSLYCNLLQCTHFRHTSVAAERAGELIGFISGYIPPEQADTLFVWQVAVADAARGEGLAKRMLHHLLQRPGCADVHFLDTTITPDNRASWALFESLARDLGAALDSHVLFERERHFGGAHDDESLLRIGPFAVPAPAG